MKNGKDLQWKNSTNEITCAFLGTEIVFLKKQLKHKF